MKNIFIGIDVSNKTLDICIKENNNNTFYTIENSISSCKKFFNKFKKSSCLTYVAMENTGRYNYNLYEALEKFSFLVYVINPIHMKKSLGLVRGKNDQVDAERIVYFIEKNHMDLPQWQPNTLAIKKLKVLQTERKHRIKIKSGLLKQQCDYKLMKSMKMDKELLKLNQSLISNIDKQLKIIEHKIELIIQEDQILQDQSNRLRTIPGVGKVLTWMILAKTDNFQMIDSARKLACYSGVVPFDHQSGTSLRYRPKVSPYADKSLKSTLHLGAMSVVKLDNDLSKYYQRKVLEGKNKMLVLNNIRNKIIHLIFAVLKSGKKYENNYQNSLAVS